MNQPMSDWLAVTLLGVLEGLTEFIPVSSTGHLLLAEHFMRSKQSDLFNIVIQVGAVLAVLPLFGNRLRSVANWRDPAGRDYLLKIALAFFITGVGGLILDKLDFKLPDKRVPIAMALIVGGVAFVGIERWLRGHAFSEDVTWMVAVAVGVGQLVAAVFPGTSRSGATILFALLLGLSRSSATEFSFLVSIPTMTAAGGLQIFKKLKASTGVSEDWAMVALGTVVAAVVSFVVVKWFLRYVQSHTFTGFGWYRIALGLAVLALLR